jgi:hypothetical protein
MKWMLTSILLAAWAGSGCITFPSWKEQPKAAAPVVVVQKPPADHPPVKPEQVSDVNARDKASQLSEELEADAHQ